MTHVLAKELCGRNITVNAIATGPTATALFLAGSDGAWINGQVLRANGGII